MEKPKLKPKTVEKLKKYFNEKNDKSNKSRAQGNSRGNASNS
jgi:hypothetical protein